MLGHWWIQRVGQDEREQRGQSVRDTAAKCLISPLYQCASPFKGLPLASRHGRFFGGPTRTFSEKGSEAFGHSPELRIGSEELLDESLRVCTHFSGKIGWQQVVNHVAGDRHLFLPFCTKVPATCDAELLSTSLARRMRDFTAPRLTPRVLAISSYDISLTT